MPNELRITKDDLVIVGQAGTDDYEGRLPEHAAWALFAYTADPGGYEGRGYGVIGYTNGSFAIVDLGHCSCNDPSDDFPHAGTLTEDELRARIGRDPNGQPLRRGEWNTEELTEMWAGLTGLGLLDPTEELVTELLTSRSRALRMYALRTLAPALAARRRAGRARA